MDFNNLNLDSFAVGNGWEFFDEIYTSRNPAETSVNIIIPPNTIDPNQLSVINVPNTGFQEYVVDNKNQATGMQRGTTITVDSPYRPNSTFSSPEDRGSQSQVRETAYPRETDWGDIQPNLHARYAKPGSYLPTHALSRSPAPTRPNRIDFTTMNAPRLGPTPPPPEYYERHPSAGTRQTLHSLSSNQHRTRAMVHDTQGLNTGVQIPIDRPGEYAIPRNSQINISVNGEADRSLRQERAFPIQASDNDGVKVNITTSAETQGGEQVIKVQTPGGRNATGSHIDIHFPSQHGVTYGESEDEANNLITQEEQEDDRELNDALREVLNDAEISRPIDDVEDLLEIHKLNEIERGFRGLREDKRLKLRRLQERRKTEEIEKRMELHRMIIDRIAYERDEQHANHQKLLQVLKEFNPEFGQPGGTRQPCANSSNININISN